MRHVFICAGQSNAQGYGKRERLAPLDSWVGGTPDASSDTGTVYMKPTLDTLPGLYNGNNTGSESYIYNTWGRFIGEKLEGTNYRLETGFGPELSFMYRFHEANPTIPVALIKCVLGGSNIKEWMPGTRMWTVFSRTLREATDRLNASGEPWKWAGMLWMQGENGAASCWPYLYPTPGDEYRDHLRAFLSATRQETDAHMPVAIGRIGNHLLADNIIDPMVGSYTAEQLRGATNYRRTQQELVAADSGNGLVDTDNLPVLQTGDPQWWYHHTGPGYLAMGERFYSVWEQLAGIEPPPPPPPLKTNVYENGILTTKTAVVTLNGQVIGGTGDTLDVVIE